MSKILHMSGTLIQFKKEVLRAFLVKTICQMIYNLA